MGPRISDPASNTVYLFKIIILLCTSAIVTSNSTLNSEPTNAENAFTPLYANLPITPVTNFTELPAEFRVQLHPLSSHPISWRILSYTGIEALASLAVLNYHASMPEFAWEPPESLVHYEVEAAPSSRDPANRQVRNVLWTIGGTVLKMIRLNQLREVASSAFLGPTFIYLAGLTLNDWPKSENTQSGVSKAQRSSIRSISSRSAPFSSAVPSDFTLEPTWKTTNIDPQTLSIMLIRLLMESLGESDSQRRVPVISFTMEGITVTVQDVRGRSTNPRMPIKFVIWTFVLLAQEYFGGEEESRGLTGDIFWDGEKVAVVSCS